MSSPQLIWLSDGGAATREFKRFWDFGGSTTGLVAVDNLIRNGPEPCTLRLTVGPNGEAANLFGLGGSFVVGDAPRRFSFWFTVDAWPTGSAATILRYLKADYGTTVVQLRMTPDGTMRIAPAATTFISVTGSTPMTTNTLHHATFATEIVDAFHFRFTLWVDGVKECEAINSGILQYNGVNVYAFEADSAFGAGHSVWISDLYVDAGDDFSDVGPIRVTNKRPSGLYAGEFSNAIGPYPVDRWLNVDGRNASNAKGWWHAPPTAASEIYGLEAANRGQVDLSQKQLIGRMPWFWLKGTEGAGGAQPRVVYIENGVEFEYVLDTYESMSWLTYHADQSTYPTDARGIGLRTLGSYPGIYFYECGVLFAYKD